MMTENKLFKTALLICRKCWSLLSLRIFASITLSCWSFGPNWAAWTKMSFDKRLCQNIFVISLFRPFDVSVKNSFLWTEVAFCAISGFQIADSRFYEFRIIKSMAFLWQNFMEMKSERRKCLFGSLDIIFNEFCPNTLDLIIQMHSR